MQKSHLFERFLNFLRLLQWPTQEVVWEDRPHLGYWLRGCVCVEEAGTSVANSWQDFSASSTYKIRPR